MDMKLEDNYKKKLEKHRKVDTKQCVTKQWIIEEIKKKKKKNLEKNETMIQNLWDAAKTVLRGKFIVIQTYLRRQEIPQTI